MTALENTRPRRAVLLVNLGTPDAPTVPAVRRYLAEFLSDPHVVDLPALFRFLLLWLVILPFRPKRSAHAYQRIWTEQGSPLLLHSHAQREALQASMPDREVALAMRYGSPSLPSVIENLRSRGVEELTVIPLYPQEAQATSGTTLERVAQLSAGLQLKIVPAFHRARGFVEAWADQVRTLVERERIEHVLFSYHGLPVRHVARTCARVCGQSEGCPSLNSQNARCYRAQCFETTRAIVEAAGLPSSSTAFQSRLKGAKWISPFTDESLTVLARSGIRRVAVACPSFVVDCLETLEEIGLRAAEDFRAAGGEALILVPTVNAAPAFISMLADEVRKVHP